MQPCYSTSIMKRASNKSHCPVNYALEAVGDTWSLLIVRDIAFWGKRTFREFLKSEESISSNILVARLESLERNGIISKTPHPTDGRKEIYSLTEKGVDLVPILLELSGWSEKYDAATTAPRDYVAEVRADRTKMFADAQNKIRDGQPLFEREQ
jgi:DNA-binding HxlR family transcriptional regulator